MQQDLRQTNACRHQTSYAHVKAEFQVQSLESCKAQSENPPWKRGIGTVERSEKASFHVTRCGIGMRKRV
jgi:hypothetical protein